MPQLTFPIKMKLFFTCYNIIHIVEIPYYPTGQETVERSNCTLKEMLAKQKEDMRTPRDRLYNALLSLYFLNANETENGSRNRISSLPTMETLLGVLKSCSSFCRLRFLLRFPDSYQSTSNLWQECLTCGPALPEWQPDPDLCAISDGLSGSQGSSMGRLTMTYL